VLLGLGIEAVQERRADVAVELIENAILDQPLLSQREHMEVQIAVSLLGGRSRC
jgi:hypothetical protein